MDTTILELLQIAIGKRDNLARPLSADEWEELYSACELQLVLGFAFSGIEKLPEEQLPPSELFDKWKEEALKEQEERERMADICRKACETHERNGFRSCVLMPRLGQVRGERLEVRDGRLEVRGNRLEVSDSRLEVSDSRLEVRDKRLEIRGNRLERPSKSPCIEGLGGDPKDVDILCWSKEKKDGKRMIVEYVNFQYVASTKHIKPKVVRHHVNFETGNIPLEVRFKSDYLNNPWYNKRFEEWLRKMVERSRPPESPCVGGEVRGERLEVRDNGLERPCELPDEFYVVYQLLHLYRKLFCEGIRLGHLVEYYQTLREVSGERLEVRDGRFEVREDGLEFRDERGEVMRVVESFGMKKFAGAVMYVLQGVFGMPDEYMICKPDARHGSFVLKMTMLAGEYTKDIERTRTLRYLGRIGHHLYWLKRNRPFITQYPAEVLFELYKRIKG